MPDARGHGDGHSAPSLTGTLTQMTVDMGTFSPDAHGHGDTLPLTHGNTVTHGDNVPHSQGQPDTRGHPTCMHMSTYDSQAIDHVYTIVVHMRTHPLHVYMLQT